MSDCEMKVDLYQLAIDAGMTEHEFKNEIGILYASFSSVCFEENPGMMITHTVNFVDHDVEIVARRVSEQKAPSSAQIN